MGKVLKADASAGDAWVEVDLGSSESELWVTCRMLFDSSALALWMGGDGGNIIELLGPTDADIDRQSDMNISIYGWSIEGNDPGAPPPTPNAWALVECHYVNGGALQLYVDSVLLFDGFTLGVSDIGFIRLGQHGSTSDPASVLYLDDFKVGTTRGGDDLFADDFEDGTLGAWTTTEGAVSVVDDPFAPPEPPELVVSAVTGIVPHVFGEADERARLAVTGSAARRPIRDLQDQNVQAVTIRVAASTGPSSSFQVFSVELSTLPADPHETGGQ